MSKTSIKNCERGLTGSNVVKKSGENYYCASYKKVKDGSEGGLIRLFSSLD